MTSSTSTTRFATAPKLTTRTRGWPRNRTKYEYDPISRLDILTHDLDGTGAANDVGFIYNPASQIITRAQINEAYEFPLTSSVKSYVTNGRNQYTQVGGTTHGWEANGNLTSDGLTTFGYDTENRLVSASGAKNASLSYDPLGRLYQMTSGSTTTRFVYDGDRLIAEYNGSGTVQRRYVHGPGVDAPLLWYEGSAVSSATRRYLHADHQGSIVAVSNPTGAMQQVRTYDAYGVTAVANTMRFQYTGQAAIPEVGLLYYKARFYNPALGRFMQTDPIAYEDNVNLYAYVGNDPLNNTDPTGKFCEGISTCAAHRETIDRAQGKISAEQVRANETARGFGTLIGIAAVTATLAAVELAPLAGPALMDGLAPLAESAAAEAAAARTVGNAAASAIRANVQNAAAGAREIAHKASNEGMGTLLGGLMETASTTTLGTAARAEIQGAAGALARAEAVGGIQTARTQAVDGAVSAWQHLIKIVDRVF